MTIHVVRPGETIYSIAADYNVSPMLIINQNQFENPDNLSVGQAVVILFPEITHKVKPGETVSSIARQYGVTPLSILQNNPQISASGMIYAGETIVITFRDKKTDDISVNGYAYPNIDRSVLRRSLPYLTYLTVFTYGITENGDLIAIDDREVIQIAKDYGVAPLMHISTLGPEGRFSNELASAVLNNPQAQERLIDQILETIQQKGYYGIDVDFEYIFPSDGNAYAEFIAKLNERLNQYGYPVFVALAPKTSATQPGLLYEAHNYAKLGAAADYSVLMTYEWGYAFGPPMAVAPINKVRMVLDYAVTEIPPEKIFMGVPNYGYDWTLPFVPMVSKARSLSNVQAIDLAFAQNAEIMYDQTAQSPYFNYYDEQGQEHVVWFEDARSIKAKAELIREYGFNGMSIWNIMRFFPQLFIVVNSMYNIRRVL